MKKIIFIILLFLGLALLNSCAKPEVVNVAMPKDNQLTCEQLDDEIIEAQKIKREAEYAKEGTGGNIARMMLFWPAWAKTMANADKAILAADDRVFHLAKIMKKKKCPGADEKISQVTKVETISKTSTSSAGIAQKLKVLSELHESGALNKEEFEKAKKKVLEE